MTEYSDLEADLRSGMRGSTATVVAARELHNRLIAAAMSGRSRGRYPIVHRFLATRTIAVAATVIAMLAVGSAVAVLQARTTPTDTGSSSSHVAGPARADCSLTGKRVFQPTTVDAVVTHSTGTWLACTNNSIFGAKGAGLQIDADGHWARLARDSKGALLALSGYRNGGTWNVGDDSAMNGRPTFQMNFKLSGSGTFSTWALFVGTAMRIESTMGDFAITYVRTSEPVVPAPSPSGGATKSACDISGKEVFQVTTVQEFTARFIGTWVACTHRTIFDTNEVGIQIDANGHFAKLVRDRSGRLVATSGYGNAGTWEVIDTSEMNGRPTFQVDFHVDGSPFGHGGPNPVFVGTAMQTECLCRDLASVTYIPASEPVVAAH